MVFSLLDLSSLRVRTLKKNESGLLIIGVSLIVFIGLALLRQEKMSTYP